MCVSENENNNINRWENRYILKIIFLIDGIIHETSIGTVINLFYQMMLNITYLLSTTHYLRHWHINNLLSYKLCHFYDMLFCGIKARPEPLRLLVINSYKLMLTSKYFCNKD
jgi:hypothetical protein